MIKSILAVSIAFLTCSTSLASYAQEPDELKPPKSGQATESARPGHSTAFTAAGEHASAKRARGAAVIPLANFFPTSIPPVRHDLKSDAVTPPATPPNRQLPGLQHEFHGNLTTFFGTSNGVPD